MRYNNITRAVFLNRPNRFIANVLLPDGITAAVHVKNTGRCRELLISGTAVYLEHSDNPSRKTKYDLIAAEKTGSGFFNIDSQAANTVMKEWLDKLDFDIVRPEYTYGNSRIDFYMKRGQEEFLLEVKGCTLERNGTGYFPDAPTERGTKHLRELTAARKSGINTGIAFVMQSECMASDVDRSAWRPYSFDDFAAAFREAEEVGVSVFYCRCSVAPDRLEITSVIPSGNSSSALWRLDTSALSADN